MFSAVLFIEGGSVFMLLLRRAKNTVFGGQVLNGLLSPCISTAWSEQTGLKWALIEIVVRV